ncbi:MAG: class I SAM-dependent methyltransferase [Candidatus Dojkabacteria bacterium]|nr:class I SAM-dependent methyltransferase [Candidatus Dojkabacteria bacterium]
MNCRICNTLIEEPFLSLKNSPLANSYLSKENLYKKEEYYPLNLYFCNNCKLVQVDDFVSSKEIFNPQYAYYSGYSQTWIEHCKNYVDYIVKRISLDKKSKVLEIGSNDGILLEQFKSYNVPVKGIEPAEEAADIAIKKGIDTLKTFFNNKLVYNSPELLHQDLIIANNVIAHNPDLKDLVSSMKHILKYDGVITVEFPHLLNLILYNQFDTVYHEHFSYFSLTSIQKLFKQHNLIIFDVEEIPTHGGSLRIYAKHDDNITHQVKSNVENILIKESEFGLNNLSTYINFKNKIEELKRNILKLLITLKDNQFKNRKYKICAYSAPAKASTLLNYCGIGTDFVEYTVDLNPQKQNKYIPGTHIPIYHPDKIKEDKPEYVIIFAWNIKDEIIKQLDYIREWNGKFITLIPEPDVI